MCSFLIQCSIICLNFIRNICFTLWWRNTSRASKSVCLGDQLSHPHRSKLQGIARNMRYLEYTSTWSSSQKAAIAPIEVFADAILLPHHDCPIVRRKFRSPSNWSEDKIWHFHLPQLSVLFLWVQCRWYPLLCNTQESEYQCSDHIYTPAFDVINHYFTSFTWWVTKNYTFTPTW